MILIDLESPFSDDRLSEGKGPDSGKGILTPDGDVINPQIEVIDQSAQTFNLVYSGSRGLFGGPSAAAPAYNLPYPNKWPTDRVYKTVRIRSTTPFKAKGILLVLRIE